jgi:hypothetical protein
MKKIIYSLILIFCSITIAQAGGDPIKKFYRKYKKQKNVRNIALPGVLTRASIGIASLFIRDPEVKAGLKVARKVRGIRVLVDEGHQVPKSAGQALIRELQQKNNMEQLVTVREDGNYTVVMGQIKGKKIKKIVVVNFSEDQFAMVAVKSRIKVKHINKMIKAFQRKERKRKKKEEKQKEPMA